MRLVSVGAKDGEDGALLARFGQQLVHVDVLLRELELTPRLALVGAEPAPHTVTQKSLRKRKALQRVPACVCT